MHPIPTILFGACERHNLGDLLFPHIAAAMLPDIPLLYAGLATRDMRPYGGHTVHAITELAREIGANPVNLVHVGGELLTCTARDAAVMLLDDETARAALERHVPGPAREAWAHSVLGTSARAPYVVPKRLFANPAGFVHNAVGGVTLGNCDGELRQEVASALRSADMVTVRDRRTRHSLAAQGIAVELVPDPGVMVAELFGERIARHGEAGEAAETGRAFPGGYLAVQFSSDFADDASLDTLAAQLDHIAGATGLGLAFFRAGAAPMHDDLALYRTVRDRMHGKTATALFQSLDIWDICSLIAASRGFVGSSLHGRIVALAYGLPRVTLASEPNAPSKHRAFVEAWEDGAMPGVVALEETARAVLAALAVPAGLAAGHARRLVSLYRKGCAGWLTRLAPVR